jgi:hypothetical protein
MKGSMDWLKYPEEFAAAHIMLAPPPPPPPSLPPDEGGEEIYDCMDEDESNDGMTFLYDIW